MIAIALLYITNDLHGCQWKLSSWQSITITLSPF